MTPWIVGAAIVGLILFLLDREIYYYEGAHLGQRLQGRLYDLWAKNYDINKQESQLHDSERIARPLMEKVSGGNSAPPAVFVLDVATGTGRMPAALLAEPGFTGHVIALDISREMLTQTGIKVKPYEGRVTLLQATAIPLPFPDATFDVVSCMEALEIMPNFEKPLAELARVLRPGGVLITTRGATRRHTSRKHTPEQFAALLNRMGFEQVDIQDWWKVFDLVWARKPGEFVPAGPRPLTEVLRCPSCKAVALKSSSNALHCAQCKAEVPITSEGIVLGMA